MVRYLWALVYLLPALWLAGYLPAQKLAWPLTGAAVAAGVLVALVHLRQGDSRGRLRVFAATVAAGLAAGAAWPMGLLALAFASDSGQHAKLIEGLMYGMTLFLILVPAPLAAWLAGRPRAGSPG